MRSTPRVLWRTAKVWPALGTIGLYHANGVVSLVAGWKGETYSARASPDFSVLSWTPRIFYAKGLLTPGLPQTQCPGVTFEWPQGVNDCWWDTPSGVRPSRALIAAKDSEYSSPCSGQPTSYHFVCGFSSARAMRHDDASAA